jgi:hypothetical protein
MRALQSAWDALNAPGASQAPLQELLREESLLERLGGVLQERVRHRLAAERRGA